MTPAQTLSKIFFEFSYYNAMHNIPFKPRAYELASESINALGDEVEQAWQSGGIKQLKELPGIGASIAEKIDEYFRTGHVKSYEKIKKEFPVDIWGISRIEGIGPKHIYDLYKHLKVKNLADLKKALLAGKVKNIPHWGEKSQAKLIKQLQLFEKSAGRMLLGNILPVADDLLAQLKHIKGVERCAYAGSIRRRQETCGDIDLLATGKNGKKIIDAFTKLPAVETIHVIGSTKASVRLKIGIDADLRVVKDKVYGSALQYFTGDKRHNVLLRELALKKGYSLNEYGLFKFKNRSRYATHDSRLGSLVVCKTEEAIYKKLGMDTPPPEIRAGEDEIEAAQNHTLPNLIPYGSVKGDLQIQTNWSDGNSSIEEMAKAAKNVGLEYIAVTDHTKSLTIAHGLDEKRLTKQAKEIDALNKQLRGFKILKGAECDILKDGSLDLTSLARSKLDFVGISIHSYFDLSKSAQTKRVIKAMSQPHIHCLFHPTCRLIGKREAIQLDMDEILATAKKYHVLLEINCMPDRMDLNDRWTRSAVKAGVKLVINTDGHAPEHFKLLHLGEAIARRGWAEKSDIINTKNLHQFLNWINKK